MKRVLITHSYYLRLDAKQWKLQQPYAPLGTIYAAAVLRDGGYDVALHDVTFERNVARFRAVLIKERPSTVVVYDDGFNYLTKMCLTNMRDAAFHMIGEARALGCTVIVHSSDATDHFAAYLEAGAHYVILGEGEQTLLELTNALQQESTDPSSIAGLAYRRDGGVLKTAPRAVLRDLDQLPLPAWDLLDLQPYRAAWMRSSGYFSINIATTRGCPYKCNWCAKPIYGNRYNVRSPRKVVDELLLLRRLVSVDHIWFCDDIFGLKPGWVAAYADLANAKGMNIPFKIQSRADLLLQPAYVHDLARAGCATVWMGAESGSQAILDAMDKGISTDQIAAATSLLRAEGIEPCFFIQFGYLGEKMQDINATIAMINRLQPAEIGISVSYPLPDTLFYEKVRAQLTAKSNWTDSDDLALMFRDERMARFYRRLHRYVHRQYRQQKHRRELAAHLGTPALWSVPNLRKLLSVAKLVPTLWLERKQLNLLQRGI
ncbi:MAG: B12-binding domain-containing radical SAM protein [Chitinophagaceae bacterium]|nr:MAG: B12-binding domain-containing radical SAM protein [Chitinophagaceae bacterium]